MIPQKEQIYQDKKAVYFKKFLENNPRIINKLTQGELFGEKSTSRWTNVRDHNILAGKIAEVICRLTGLLNFQSTILNKLLDEKEVVFMAGTHDWDKKIKRKAAKINEKHLHGQRVIEYDVQITIQQETSKEKKYWVTGDDLRGYENWGLAEEIVRYTDSASMPYKGNSVFVRPADRLTDLANRHALLNKLEGDRLYYGIPLYIELAQITKKCEEDIYKTIKRKNPDLAEKYQEYKTTEEKLYYLLSDKMNHEIEEITQEEIRQIQNSQETRVGDLINLRPYDKEGRLVV